MAMIDIENISGEIQNTLSGESLNDADRTKLQAVKQWIIARNSQMKPWRAFCNTKKFSKPKNAGEVSTRIIGNVKMYQANYVAISLMLSLYCIFTSPLLLIGLAVSIGGCSYISKRGNGQPISILGRELTVFEQYGLVFLISLPLFLLASAGSAVFWVIGASVFTIFLHASMLELSNDADSELKEVTVQNM